MTDAVFPSLDQIERPGPARELWGTAAQRESYHPDLMLQTWLAAHESASSEDQRHAIRAVLDLQTAGVPVADAMGKEAFRLPSAQQLDILETLGAEGLRELSAVDEGPQTLAERLFQKLLKDRSSSEDRGDRTYIMALNAVAPWASAAGIKLNFDPEEMEQALSRMDFLRTLGGPDLHRFIGRTVLRRELRHIWRAACEDVEPSPPVLIEGPGGNRQVPRDQSVRRGYAGNH